MVTDSRNHSRTIGLIVAALLMLPAGLVAQQGHRHGQREQARDRQMPGMMMGMQEHGQMMGMMGTMGVMAGPSPAMILHQREALELTPQQVQALEALQERVAQSQAQHMESMRAAHRQLAEQAGDPDADLAAYESALRSLADQHVAMHMASARAGREARDLLTPEQREKLRVGMRFMRGMMMHRMQGPMDSGGGMGSILDRMPCPMMGGSGGPNR